MNDYIDTLHDICDVMMKELEKSNEKIKMSGGEVSGSDIEYLDKLTHGIKSTKTTIAMMEADDEYSGDYDSDMNMRGGRSNRGYSRRGSYARGRGRNARRDSMGRYSSRDGYSMGGDEMIMELRELMEDAPDEKTRMEFQRFIKKMEQM